VIVTDEFVFLHLHKSGGSFVNEFLKRSSRPRGRSAITCRGAWCRLPMRTCRR
jgi:hypothetical protein